MTWRRQKELLAADTFCSNEQDTRPEEDRNYWTNFCKEQDKWHLFPNEQDTSAEGDRNYWTNFSREQKNKP